FSFNKQATSANLRSSVSLNYCSSGDTIVGNINLLGGAYSYIISLEYVSKILHVPQANTSSTASVCKLLLIVSTSMPKVSAMLVHLAIPSPTVQL
ncbi:unnamed protein product, partial [Sphagnum balticum]